MSINQQHAHARLELMILQKDLSQINRKKEADKAGQLKKAVATKKHTIEQLESDWDYAGKEAEAIFTDLKRTWDEEVRLERESHQRTREEKEEEIQLVTNISTPEDDPQHDEEGFFGLFDDQMNDNGLISPSSKVMNIIDVSPRSSQGHKWSGSYPKKLLNEHCRGIDTQSKQSYTITSPATNLFHASVKIKLNDKELVFSMEPGSVVQSKAESQEYVAVGGRGALNY